MASPEDIVVDLFRSKSSAHKASCQPAQHFQRLRLVSLLNEERPGRKFDRAVKYLNAIPCGYSKKTLTERHYSQSCSFPHTQQQNQSNKLTDTANHSLAHRSTGDKGMRHLNIVVEPAIAVQTRRDLLADLFIRRLRAFAQHEVLEQFFRHGQTLRCQ